MNENRETRGEAADACNVPASRQALREGAESPVKRDGPVVARHEIMRHVERREAAAEPVIRKIHQVSECRSVVDRLGKSVGGQERHIGGLPFHRGLEGVVI